MCVCVQARRFRAGKIAKPVLKKSVIISLIPRSGREKGSAGGKRNLVRALSSVRCGRFLGQWWRVVCICHKSRRTVVAPKCWDEAKVFEGKSCVFMFMFRGRRSAHSRRSALSRRLVKVHKRRADETASETLRQPLEELFERLQDKQLEMLMKAVDARGWEPTGCVLLPGDGEPHVLCCQAWRWPKLRQATELKRLPCCQSACDPVYVCCNPYHWSRFCRPPGELGFSLLTYFESYH